MCKTRKLLLLMTGDPLQRRLFRKKRSKALDSQQLLCQIVGSRLRDRVLEGIKEGFAFLAGKKCIQMLPVIGSGLAGPQERAPRSRESIPPPSCHHREWQEASGRESAGVAELSGKPYHLYSDRLSRAWKAS
jgi:hypothetical protein